VPDDSDTPEECERFETVEQFGEWLEASREKLLGHIRRLLRQLGAKIDAETTSEDILGIGIIEVVKLEAWKDYDSSKGASASTWFTERLQWRTKDYLERAKIRGTPTPEDQSSLSSTHICGGDNECWDESGEQCLADNKRSSAYSSIVIDEKGNIDVSDRGLGAEIIIEDAERTEQKAALAEALQNLDPLERQAVQLFFLEELSEKDIARKLNLTGPNQVAKLKQSAFAKMRRCKDLRIRYAEGRDFTRKEIRHKSTSRHV
jgi:RNA polymerase sigma factor (sigma-70 family)